MTPAALIRAQQLRTPFRRLGQRRARWLAWRRDRTTANRHEWPGFAAYDWAWRVLERMTYRRKTWD